MSNSSENLRLSSSPHLSSLVRTADDGVSVIPIHQEIHCYCRRLIESVILQREIHVNWSGRLGHELLARVSHRLLSDPVYVALSEQFDATETHDHCEAQTTGYCHCTYTKHGIVATLSISTPVKHPRVVRFDIWSPLQHLNYVFTLSCTHALTCELCRAGDNSTQSPPPTCAFPSP